MKIPNPVSMHETLNFKALALLLMDKILHYTL